MESFRHAKEFITKFSNLQFFSEQPVEHLHSYFEKMIHRVTSRDENVKIKLVASWLYHRNIISDMLNLEKAELIPMSSKQRGKYKRNLYGK